MKLFPVHSLLWSGLLVWWILPSEIEGNNCDICQEGDDSFEIFVENASMEHCVDKSDVEETCVCLLYPSNELNCSWSFHTSESDSQLSVHVSVCNEKEKVQSQSFMSVEKVGSACLMVTEREMGSVIVRFNMSQQDRWTSYTFKYELANIDLLSPPQNIRGAIKDEDLIVTWDKPRSRLPHNIKCFEHQLDLGDQSDHKIVNEGHRSYTEKNADPTCTYRLRMRSRISPTCYGCAEWSDWSHVVFVESTLHTVSLVMIILLSLGIPMILLALLLVARHQRVFEILFPPIPRPPQKYKFFLEKNDALNLFYPAAAPAKPEEEITEVQDTEQNPAGTT